MTAVQQEEDVPASSPGDLEDVELVVVAYHSRSEIEQLLATWPSDLRVVLVDNSPGAEVLDDLVAGHPSRRLVPDGPGGFAGGANLGAFTSSSDILIFVNPDSRPTVEVLTALAAEVRTGPPTAGVAALLIQPDGRPQLGSGGWRPTLRRVLVHALALHAVWPHAGLVGRFAPGRRVDPDWVSAACLAVPRDVFLQLKGFDERYFVYQEDVDYGLRAAEAALPVRLRTDLHVPHEGAGSGASRTRNAWLKGRAQSNWIGDHLPPVRGRLMRTVLVVAFVLRVPMYFVQGRRTLAWEAVWFVRGLAGGHSSARTPFSPPSAAAR